MKTSRRILIGFFGIACTVIGAAALSHIPWAVIASRWALSLLLVLAAISSIFGPKTARTVKSILWSLWTQICVPIWLLYMAYDLVTDPTRPFAPWACLAIGLFLLLTLAMDSLPGNRAQAAARRWASRFTQ